MYTDPITGNAIHIHMLSLATIAAALIYLDTPNPPTPLPILPPIIQLPMNPPTNVNVIIANPQNKTLRENLTPHTIDIDMHIQSPTNPLTNVPVMIPDPQSTTRSEDALEDAEIATDATAYAKSVAAIVAPVPNLTPTHAIAPPYALNTTVATTANEIGAISRPTKKSKPVDEINNNTGSTAMTPQNASKPLRQTQRRKAAARAAMARKANRPTKRPRGTNTMCKKKAIAKAKKAQEKLNKRNRGPRRF
jgi:hypothetical protein